MTLIHRSLVATALCIAAAGATAQNLVTNGSFESPLTNYVICYQGSTLGAWTSSGPAESCYLSSLLPDPWPDAIDGTQFMYLGQSLAANVTLSQSVPLEAGVDYALHFSLAGLRDHPGATVEVSIDGQTSGSFVIPNSDSTWRPYQLSFTSSVTGSRTLSFVSPTGGAVNIESVSLMAVAIPEPAAGLLALLGLPLVLWARRRPAA